MPKALANRLNFLHGRSREPATGIETLVDPLPPAPVERAAEQHAPSKPIQMWQARQGRHEVLDVSFK